MPRYAAISFFLVTGISIGIVGCESEQPLEIPPPLFDTQLPQPAEGEFLGNVYINGVKTSSTQYGASLIPFDSATSARLRSPHSTSMWADPNGPRGWMYEWSDPKAGNNCGSLTPYLAGDTTARVMEQHRPGPGQSPPNERESHCIRPGTYLFGVGEREFLVDYLPITPAVPGAFGTLMIWNTTPGAMRNEQIQAENFDDTLNVWPDFYAQADFGTATYSEFRALDIENAASNREKSTFANQTNPSGDELDWFRFSITRDTSTWPGDSWRGRFLARLYWDFGTNKNIRTNYYDGRAIGVSNAQSLLRTHQFESHVTSTRDVTVAVEIMRPDEDPDDTLNVATRTVHIDRLTPVACADNEYTTTWKNTDQYFTVDCSSRGPTFQYRWRFQSGAAWTPFTNDTLYDFLGHSTSATHTVTLEVKNTSTGATSQAAMPITVQADRVVLSGPTYVTDKLAKTYTATQNGNPSQPHSGKWFERYNPALKWFAASFGNQTSLTRIWPAGNYSVELRQNLVVSGVVRRGRLHIEVCNGSCSPALIALSATANSVSEQPSHLFGAGPWITWGESDRRALRLYDLWGMHDGETAFAEASWIAGPGGSFADPETGWEVSWRPQDTGLSGVRAYDFTISSPGPAYTFGMGVDPDVDGTPADDIAGYDGARGLIHVSDASGAVGFLLLQDDRNAISSGQEYGVGRFAPTVPDAAWDAQRTPGIGLIRESRDVQLVLSAAETRGTSTWTFVMIEGSSLKEIQDLADQAVTLLGNTDRR